MSKTANDRGELSQATIELMDLEIPTSDGSQIKAGNHENDQPYTDKWELRRSIIGIHVGVVADDGGGGIFNDR
jgi:hypothetical protein